MTGRESLAQSRKHELKCQLCAGETPGGVHSARQDRCSLCAAESHTCKQICTSTHAGKLSSYVNCTVLHLHRVDRLIYMVITPREQISL